MSEKSEQPTPKKRRDARQKGQVAQSKDLTSVVVLAGLFAVLYAYLPFMLRRLEALLLAPTRLVDVPIAQAMSELGTTLFVQVSLLVLPVVLAAALLGIIGNIMQVGFLLSFQPVKPDLKKLNPGQGIKKIFSLKNLVELLKSVVKIVFLGVLSTIVIMESLEPLLKLPYCGQGCLLPILGQSLLAVAAYTGVAFLVIAGFDLAFQRFQHTKELKMTKDEVKREYKEMEGDPLIKGKRRQLHQQMAMSAAEHNVRHASVVITNPTRIAVALYYEDGETPLPLVVAKGEQLRAQRIIAIAREAGVPIMENVPLARSLYADVDIDQYIPRDLVEPVAEVLRWVREQRRAED